MDLEESLAQLPLFTGIDKKSLRQIAKSMKQVHYERGHTVIQENMAGIHGGMGIVLHGLLQVQRGGQVIGHIQPGEFFGEMALVDQQPRSASVIAEAPTDAATISAWHLRGLIQANPEIAIHMLRTLSTRLREARASQASPEPRPTAS
jgi:CRP-like cAMP-binding protein